MCRLRNKAIRDYQERVTTDRHTDRRTDGRTDRHTEAGQSDPYVPLCVAGNTKTKSKGFPHRVLLLYCMYYVRLNIDFKLNLTP